MELGATDRRRWVLEALDRHEQGLLRFAARMLGDEDAARDAVQHAFLRLCSQPVEGLNGRVGPWLFAVCRHYAIDAIRKRGNASAGDVAAADCCDRAPDPAASAERADLYQSLNRLVDQLPVAQREAVSLWAEGMSYREIAEATDATEGNVRVIVHRAIQRLRQHPAVQRML
jgi:RNA polymerase sigma factor (sigma-70 family)